ncbi:MAG: hypothetical protein EKK37_01725 [Sphingobacteriales bacterium]|nr:MAG: hypothetical protein EKK37_01725 [Sphingobacteriales bacterium]
MKKLIGILSTLILAASCTKEDSFGFNPNQLQNLDSSWVTTIPDQSKICELVKSLPAVQPITDSVEILAADTTVISKDLYDILIPPKALKTSSGAVVTGKVAFNFYFTEKLGDYIRLQQSTINSSQYLLSTNASFYLRFFLGADELAIIAGKNIIVRYNDPQPKQNMKLFYGPGDIGYTTPVNNTILWYASTSNCYVTPVARKLNATYYYAYEVSTDRLKWINIASGLPQGLTLLNLSVYLPDLFSNANTQAFIIFKDTKTLVKLNGEASTRKFTAPNIPAGVKATVVTISKSAEEYYLGTQEIITTDKPLQVKPIKSSLDQIINFINSL